MCDRRQQSRPPRPAREGTPTGFVIRFGRGDPHGNAGGVSEVPSGFVIMRKPIPAIGIGDNPGRRGFEG